MEEEDVVNVARRDRVAVITLTRPDRRNALHRDMFDPIKRALAEFADHPEVGCIVLTGAGSAFCAGGDVRDARPRREGHTPPTDDERSAQLLDDAQLSVLLHQHPKLTIAAVNGPAVGAGLALALACDLRIAAASARLVTGWARLAFSGDYGGAWFLTRLIGPSHALELLASNGALTASEAHTFGLVNRVVADDEFAAAWFEWASTFANGPTSAIEAMKSNVREAMRLPLVDALPLETARMIRSANTANHRAAVRAWLDGRAPDYRNVHD